MLLEYIWVCTRISFNYSCLLFIIYILLYISFIYILLSSAMSLRIYRFSFFILLILFLFIIIIIIIIILSIYVIHMMWSHRHSQILWFPFAFFIITIRFAQSLRRILKINICQPLKNKTKNSSISIMPRGPLALEPWPTII